VAWKNKWWFWLVFGLSTGVAVSLWIVALSPTPVAHNPDPPHTPQPAVHLSQQQVGSTFSIQFAQLLHGMPQPCAIKVTDPTSSELGRTIQWVLLYGNNPQPIFSCGTGGRSSGILDDGIHLAKPTTEPGITVHYRLGYEPGERIAHFLDSMGALVRKSRELDSDAPDYLIWLDFGPGSPWK
jgi:hypothetical protein